MMNDEEERAFLIHHSSFIIHHFRPGLWPRHADEAAVVLASQGPQKGANVGALEEETNCVDADPILAADRAVPVAVQLAANVLAQQVRSLRLIRDGAVLFRRQSLALVGQAVGV